MPNLVKELIFKTKNVLDDAHGTKRVAAATAATPEKEKKLLLANDDGGGGGGSNNRGGVYFSVVLKFPNLTSKVSLTTILTYLCHKQLY